MRNVKPVGVVTLVGAGPGEPGLLTREAFDALSNCDAVVYDRLASPEMLEFSPPNAKRIFVGKTPGCGVNSQSFINATLVQLAKDGLNVVRLKGGDPFIFGRGGEEILKLRAAGIQYKVIPGITAAFGAAAEFGFPLTHRGFATGVHFVTGHRQDDGELDLPWNALADAGTTVVVYMGHGNLDFIVEKLMEAGRNKLTPAAVIMSATRASQQMTCSFLKDLPSCMRSRKSTAPMLIVIGKVVILSPEWQRQMLSEEISSGEEVIEVL